MRQTYVRTFRGGILFLFVIHLVLTITAMVLIERMIPLHDVEVARLMDNQKAIQTLHYSFIAKGQSSPELVKNEEAAWLALSEEASWTPEQYSLIQQIRSAFSEATYDDPAKVHSVFEQLETQQADRVRQKLDDLRLRGLAGSWSIALVSFVILLSFYRFKVRIQEKILDPVSEIARGLHDWQAGNKQRRLRSPLKSGELHESILILNEILDDRSKRL